MPASQGRLITLKATGSYEDLSAPTVEYNTEVAADNPDHWWHLGEPSGNFVDSGSLNLPLSVQSQGSGSSVTRNVNDVVEHIATPDGALEFNQVNRANGSWLQGASIGALTWPLTIEAWFIAKPLVGDLAVLPLVSTHVIIDDGYRGFTVAITRPSNGAAPFMNYADGGGQGFSIATYGRQWSCVGITPPIPFDGVTRNHIVFRFETNLTASIVLNGVVYAPALIQSGVSTVDTSAGSFNIGMYDSSSVPNTENYTHGIVDEVAIYKNTNLSDARAIAHYQAGATTLKTVNLDNEPVGGLVSKTITIGNETVDITSGDPAIDAAPAADYSDVITEDAPDHWWRLGEDSGVTAFDSAGSVNLTYQSVGSGSYTLNQTDLVQHDVPDGCVQLNGVDRQNGGMVAGSSVGTLNFPITLEAWFYIDNFAVGNIAPILGTHVIFESVYRGFYIWITATGAVFLNYGDGSQTPPSYGPLNRRSYISAAGIISTLTPYHIVACFPDNSNAHCYINGNLVATPYLSGNATTVDTASGTMHIGAFDTSATADDNFFAGRMDEVAIYKNKTLSAERALAHYQAGIGTLQGVSQGAWRRLLGDCGQRTISIGGTSVFADDTASRFMEAKAMDGSLFQLTAEMPDGRSFTGNFQVASLEKSAEHLNPLMQSLSLEGSGTLIRCVDTYSAQVLADNPVGYWRLGDDGSIAVDQIGTYNGTYQGTYTQGVDDLPENSCDGAASFGSGGKVLVNGTPVGVADELVNFTMEAWVFTPADVGSSVMLIIDQRDNTPSGSNGNIGLSVRSTAQGQKFRVDKFPPESAWFESNLTVQPSTLYHVVYVETPSSRTFIINGVLENQDSSPETYTGANCVKFAIGNRADDGTNRPFTGTIDEVAIYHSALTLERAIAHYNAGI